MAHITLSPLTRPSDDPPAIRQPGPDERRTALAVLLTGRANPQDPAVEHFMAFTRDQGLPLDGLWALYDGPKPLTAALLIPGVGRTAVMFVTPARSAMLGRLGADLVRAVLQRQDPDDIRLIQTLLELSQTAEQQALIDAGFNRLASLVYMRRSSHGPADGRELAADDSIIQCDGKRLNACTWSIERYDRFARVIEDSYIDTLDCPGLVGVRRIDDIIAGHKAVGRFEPGLWTAYYMDDQPAGVMLLNPLIDRTELELVYLGIAPAFRGKGLGMQLMQHAFALARKRRDTGIHLAVDQDNAPAVKLYQRLGFRATGRKLAMICVLK